MGAARAKKWYGGTVVASNDDGTYDIKYADGDTEDNVLPHFIKRQGENAPLAPEPVPDWADASPAASPSRAMRARKPVDYRASEGRLDDMELSCSDSEEAKPRSAAARRRQVREEEEDDDDDDDDEGEQSPISRARAAAKPSAKPSAKLSPVAKAAAPSGRPARAAAKKKPAVSESDA